MSWGRGSGLEVCTHQESARAQVTVQRVVAGRRAPTRYCLLQAVKPSQGLFTRMLLNGY